MKTKIKFLRSVLGIGFILFLLGCNKDDDATNTTDSQEIEILDGVNLDEFEIDQGEIGISISARDISRKGHKPFMAAITVTSAIGDYSQEVPLDPFTNIANLSFKNENLTEEAVTELKNGIPLTIQILDENSQVLATREISKYSFTPSPSRIEIIADDLVDLYAKVSLREDVVYYVQLVEEKSNKIFGAPNSKNYPLEGNNVRSPIFIDKLADLDYNSENTEIFTTYSFKEVPGKEGEDIYSMSVHDGDDIHYAYISNDLKFNIQTKQNLALDGANKDVGNHLNFQFKIEKIAPGLYTLVPESTGIAIGYSSGGGGGGRLFSRSDIEPIFFRILSFDIDWEIVSLDTKFMQPILPPSNTSSAYNHYIKNCASGSASLEVGESKTLETNKVVGWEETMSVSSSREQSVSVTIEAEVAIEFFGAGGSLKTSTTEDYSFNTTRTSVSSNSESFEEKESTDVSIKRIQNIPPNTVTLVADVYQTYENVRIPFVKRFRIRGIHQKSGESLTGNEIITQFTFNNFTGVVTDVKSDFIEVTVRGTNIIDRLVDTQIITEDIEGGCDN